MKPERKTKILVPLFMVLIAVPAWSALSDDLVERAENGDSVAILEIGRSGNAEYLPILRSFQVKRRSPRQQLRLAMAKLGDQESMQYFACQTLTNDPRKIQDLLAGDIQYIGGDFRIRVFRSLLDSDPRFSGNASKKGSDELLVRPSSMVLPMLSKVLPEAGIPAPHPLDTQASRDAAFKEEWRTWIDTHPKEVRKVPPIAEGVSFSPEACSAAVMKH